MNEDYKIDAVILWVDGNDPEWIKERNKYSPEKHQDVSANRYRDWDTLKYLFRSIEKYAPWINQVFFVTCGQYPEWLKKEHPRLRFVRHSDFIPEKYLPTFSSRAIDLNLCRIEGLSEHFIYFNDDMFLTKPVQPSDFFVNGRPRDMFSERPIFPVNGVFSHNILNISKIINRHFKRREVLKSLRSKVLNFGYGKMFFYNLIWYFLPYQRFSCLYINHLPMAWLKSIQEQVWRLEGEVLEDTVSHRFRTVTDVNIFLFHFWTLLSGQFEPANMARQGRVYLVKDNRVEGLCKDIASNRYKRICINDECDEACFQEVKGKIIDAFEKILPEKSSFETERA